METRPRTALGGVRVLELADGAAASYCGRQFAQWGADVVVLEGPGGSRLRRLGPKVQTAAGEESLLWQTVAANKRAMSLAPHGPNVDGLLDLAARADVLVTDWPAAELETVGLGPEELRRRFPGLVLVSVSPFGLQGPYAGLAGSELVVQAFCGYLGLNGKKGRPPLKAPGHILGYACGVAAFLAALAALIARLGSGRGRFIEVSEFDVVAAILPLLPTEYGAEHPQREGGPATGVRAHRCRDGWVTFIPPPDDLLSDYGAALGVADHEWPPAVAGEDAATRRRSLIPFLAEKVKNKAADDVFLGLLKHRVVCGKVLSPADLLTNEHLTARGFFRPLAHRELGDLPFPGPPARLGRTGAVPPRPAPNPDDRIDRSELDWPLVEAPAAGAMTGRSEAGHGDGPEAGRPGGGADQESGEPATLESLPLAGVQIVDLTQAWIGPFAAMTLADLGAEVVKVESHLRPDVWRRWLVPPTLAESSPGDHVNTSPFYNSVNRNKRSLCLNLKTDEGLALLRRLTDEADIVMENFTPRVIERFGLDWPELAETNPRLVMTSWSGFGKTGPLSDYKANGTSIEALAGWDLLHRYPDGDPIVMGFYQADAITGLQMAATTLVGLFHSRRTGEGQAIDGSMIEAAAGYLGETLLDGALGGLQTPCGNRDTDHAPHGVYPCAGEDRWIALAVGSDEAWRRLRAVAGLETLADPIFDRHGGRIEHGETLDELISAWTRTRQAEDLMDRLQAEDIAAAVVRTTEELMVCPHLEHRRWFRWIRHPDLGEHRYNGHLWRLDGLQERSDRPPPKLGQHSRELLRKRLDRSEAQIERLFDLGVTGAVETRKPSGEGRGR